MYLIIANTAVRYYEYHNLSHFETFLHCAVAFASYVYTVRIYDGRVQYDMIHVLCTALQ